ncbi:phage terminase small subunit [Nocardia sp. NPDC001965]
MGTRGPVPKRSDERIRRNKDEVPIEKIEAIGPVEVPDLGFKNPHPLVKDLYDSLSQSAQSQFYEPSDWQYARTALFFLDKLLRSARPNGQMLATVNSMFTDLLLSEGARRRVRLEVERNQAAGDVIDVAEMFARRLAQQG